MKYLYRLLVVFLLFFPHLAFGSEVLEKSDQLWRSRDQNGNSLTAIRLLEGAIQDRPQEFVLHWHLSRFYYWAAAEATDDARKKRYAKKGWDAAERAKKIHPDSIEGWYWATANIGLFGEAVGTIGAMRHGLGDVYTSNANRAIAIDPLYDDGGPYRSLGRYYTKLPWPMQDLKRSLVLIKKSLAQNRNRALTLYFYADAQAQLGSKEGARKSLQTIISLQATGKFAPEIRRYQVLARKRLLSL